MWRSWRAISRSLAFWSTRRRSASPRKRHGCRGIELLEDRTLLAIDIVFDYTYDTNGFFNVAGRKAALEMAGRLFEQAVTDTLTAISPSGKSGSWTAQFDHPQTGNTVSLSNPTIPTNEVRIYVGARDLPGSTRGQASSGWSASGTSSWLSTVQFRGNTGTNDVGPWGGSITFDSNTNWHVGIDTQNMTSSQSDLYGVAIHEIGHLLGISTGIDAWSNQISGGTFNGTNAKAANGGLGLPVSGGHLQDNLMVDGQEVAMSPTGTFGKRDGFTRFDWAVLDDIGWTLRFDENAAAGIGQLVVQVKDAQGNPIAGKQVTISGGGTIVDPTGTTDQYGLYSSFVTRGNYNVTVDGNASPVSVTGTVRGVVITPTTPPPPSGGDGILLFDQSTLKWKLATNTGKSFSWSQTNSLPTNSKGWMSFVGDFNGDDLLDGMVLNLETMRFNFYRNTGNGTLANPVSAGGLSTAVTWGKFQVGDYNGDGKDEILAQILAGTGTGSLRSQDVNGVSRFYGSFSTAYQALLTGDFNGDGVDDLVGLIDNPAKTQANIIQFISIPTPAGRRLTAVLGSGAFGQSVATGGLHNFLVDDFNGDGRDDLALRNANGQVYHATTTGTPRTQAPGTFNFVVSNRAPKYAPADYPLPLLAGRFTNDARADLFGFRSGTNGFWVGVSSINTNPSDDIPDGSLVQTLTGFGTGVAGQRYIAGDFNKDGIEDVAVLNTTASVFLSTGTQFGSSQNFGTVIDGAATNIGALQVGKTS